MSIIEKKPYKERVKRTEYPKWRNFRDDIRNAVDKALAKKPKDFEEFLHLLEQDGYHCKRGKHTALKREGQERFIRFRSLGEGYTEEDIRAAIIGDKVPSGGKEKELNRNRNKLNLLIDIDTKLQSKGIGYQRWATVYNLKQMAQTMIFLREQGIEDMEQLQERTVSAVKRYEQLDEKVKNYEKQLREIAMLKKHIINYAKTREIYSAYRKSGYSREFFESHRESIILHKAAKDAFNEMRIKKLPRAKELTVEYSKVLAEKKAVSAEYWEARSEMREFLKAKKNVEQFLDLEEKKRSNVQKQKKEMER